MLKGKIALVTGASRGIGRGIALQLGTAGATVYVTGRKPTSKPSHDSKDLPTLEKTAQEITDRGGRGIAVYCDHSDADDIKNLFEQIEKDNNGQLDILVNNAYSAVNTLLRNDGKKFWEMDPLVWDEINNVGLRNHYICSVYAARLMVPRKSGLIVNVSSSGGLKYLFNVAYGVGKEACDRMAVDCAIELKRHNVACISLWPGAVRTELVTSIISEVENPMKKVFEEGETIEYSGKCVVHLAADPNIMQKSGRILITSDLGDTYGFTDLDGRRPPSVRSLKFLLEFAKWHGAAAWIPDWVKLPGWLFNAGGNKF
jgi:dehydrogenase/reductase SDR family protein 1